MSKIKFLGCVAVAMFLFAYGEAVAAQFSVETDAWLEEAKKGNEITAIELKKLIDSDTKIILLDVREAEQRSEGEILGPLSGENIAITKGSLEFEVAKKIKNKNALIVTYCRGGYRCALSAESLKRLGYKNVKSLQGGLKSWVEQGYAVESALGTMILKK